MVLYLFPLTLKMRFASDHSLDIGFRDQSNNLEKEMKSILFRKVMKLKMNTTSLRFHE